MGPPRGVAWGGAREPPARARGCRPAGAPPRSRGREGRASTSPCVAPYPNSKSRWVPKSSSCSRTTSSRSVFSGSWRRYSAAGPRSGTGVGQCRSTGQVRTRATCLRIQARWVATAGAGPSGRQPEALPKSRDCSKSMRRDGFESPTLRFEARARTSRSSQAAASDVLPTAEAGVARARSWRRGRDSNPRPSGSKYEGAPRNDALVASHCSLAIGTERRRLGAGPPNRQAATSTVA